MAYIFLLMSVCFNAAGQILMKYAADDLNFDGDSRIAILRQTLLNPYIVGGVFLYVLGLGSWLATLTRLELSVAYPFLALTYVLVTILSFVIFKEAITAWKIAGIAIILLGILILGIGISRES